jgi:hypothetical protein
MAEPEPPPELPSQEGDPSLPSAESTAEEPVSIDFLIQRALSQPEVPAIVFRKLL